MKDALEPSPATPQETQRDAHVVRGRFQVGDPVPMVLTIDQIRAITGYSRTQIHRFRAAGTHPGIKALDSPGHPRFCGRAMKAWLESGAIAPVRRVFFGTAVSRRRR